MEWQTIIQELRDAGVTQSEQAKACGLSPQSMSELANGIVKEPKHSVGAVLLGLHMQHVGGKQSTKAAA